MMSSGRYTITEVLSRGGRISVYRALGDHDHQAVILKVLDTEHRQPQDLDRLKQEYDIGARLATAATLKPLALETHDGRPALVLEDFGGRSLDGLLGVPMAVERFLPLASRIAGALAQIHDQGLVHRDLKPANILVNPATDEVKIADLGIAAQLPRAHQVAQPPRHIEGSLPYLSPEQTGRVNRPVDARADLYALGITFHELLAGRLPFEARDPVEWIHCHIARTPPLLSTIAPGVPEVLAQIVRKLLSKMPEDRYQSARGLRVDLELCIERQRRFGVIEPFPLGTRDSTGRLELPRKLYGREAEVAALEAAFARVLETGTPELLLVSGYSGIGKSTLVRQLYEPVLRERGFFVEGKVDQRKRDIPHATVVEALTALVLQILADSEARVATFRAALLAALGGNAQLIIDVIPSVELVVGPQPRVPDLPPLEAKNRFRRVLGKFISVFAQRAHPLVLFLDDLQWADPASLAMLEDLLTRPEGAHLLVVGAYRDNEVSADHALLRTLEQVKKEGARVVQIVLGPLPAEGLAALVGEALRQPGEVQSLARLVYEKTGGNPFFAIQFLSALHEEHLIELDEATHAFRWDVAKIAQKNFTDNVAELVVGKLRRLAPETQEALRRLACLGHGAEVGLLTLVLGGSEHDTHAALWEAGAAGLVLRVDGTYKFLHDRIQEAAYSLIPEPDRPAAHLAIGRLLLAATPASALAAQVFDLINQFNRALPLITSRQERAQIAELNRIAGSRAKQAMAYASALRYFEIGAELLAAEASDDWAGHYELGFALELNRAECEFLTGALAAEEARLGALWPRARGLVDIAAVTCAQIVLYTTLDRSDRAVEACIGFLRHVGIDWSPHPSDAEVRAEYDKLWQKLGDRSIEGLVDLPPVSDPSCRALMDVLSRSQSAALFTDDNLHCLVVGRMANISLEHGNSDGSCLAFIRLGSLLGPRFGDYQTGFRFGKLGLDLVERRHLLGFKARAYLDFAYLVHPWIKHVRSSLDLLRIGFDVAQETGDLMFASYARNRTISLLLAAGESLALVQREAEQAGAFARNARFGLVVDIITGQLALIRTLRGLTPAFASMDDAAFAEATFEQHLRQNPRLALPACWYWIRKLQARTLAGEYPAALAAAAEAQRLLWTSPSFFELAEFHWYRALALAATAEAPAAPEQRQQLADHHAQLATWAASCPENFADRAALVGAELARIEGRSSDAAELYERAITCARASGFVHNQAIAYETAARFYRARGFALIADTYLREARDRYQRWGADGKVRALEQQFPQLAARPAPSASGTLALRAEELDVHSLIKVSQTISSEIVMDKLLRTLLDVVLEQSGAQRACLLLRRQGDLSIEAEAALSGSEPAAHVIAAVPVDSSQRLPLSIVHYVQRTRERVILDDAATRAGRFAADDYLRRVQPKAVLCMPILRQAEVVGLLYLENNLLAGAFTAERLVALELFATQAAISLQNALLLANEKVARAAAEDSERRAGILAEAGAIFSASLDQEETLTRLGELCVRLLGDWCVIDIVEGDAIRRVAVAHADPDKREEMLELKRRYPPRFDSPHPAAAVLRSKRSLLVPEATPEIVRRSCEDDEHHRLLTSLGLRTALAVPLVARGQTIGVLSLASGAPGRRYGRAELELAEEVASRAAMAIDNARLYRASLEAIRARDEFLNVASHELNTPVTSLLLAVHAARDAAPSDGPLDVRALLKALGIVVRQGSRLAKLIRDLLDVSRIEAGRLPFELSEVELGPLVREVVERFEVDLARAGCSISIAENGAIVGRWDRSRIDQVLTNLLSNAIKFGPGKPIELTLSAAQGRATVSVRDHGIGMDDEQSSRIFGRFERAVSERNYGGLGLGLYISSRILEGHGGSIRCASEPGGGSVFTIELPCTPPERSPSLPT